MTIKKGKIKEREKIVCTCFSCRGQHSIEWNNLAGLLCGWGGGGGVGHGVLN